jgi:membrane fusion protein (multidrug efflux system)
MTLSLRNIISLLLLAPLTYSCGNKKQKEAEVTATKVTVAPINLQEREDILNYSGTIEADNTVSLGFSIPGRVLSVNVQEGQHVKKGQLMATIETQDYQNAFVIAKAVYDQAADNFKRLNELYQKNSLPERDFISAKSAMAQARANRDMSSKKVADTRLYAPFTGILTEKLIESGASAAPGVPAFTLVKTDQVYARVSVTESEIANLSLGVNAFIDVPVLDKKLEGKVNIINPKAENTSKTYAVKIRLNNSDGKLLPGMIANILIKTGRKQNTILIPTQSIVRDPDNITYVFIAKDNNTAIRKRITTSSITGMNEVIVTSGINPGDKLIISGQTQLEDGSQISFIANAISLKKKTE